MGITEVLTFEVNDLASGQIGNIASMTRRAMESIGQATVKAALAAATADRAERRLFEAMRLRSGITRDAFNSLKSFNQGLERKLGLDADNLAQIQGTLSLQGVANSKMQEATEFTIGLAEVTGSLETASRLVARAYEGNYTGLKKYLPQVHDAATAHEELTKLFQLAQSNSDDLVTGLNKLTIAWGNLEEAAGRNRTIQNAVAGGTQALTDIIDIASGKLERNESVVGTAATALSQLNEVVLGFSIPAALGFVNSLEDEKSALDSVAEASRSTKSALEEQLRIQEQLKQAGGFAEFGEGEGETITSDPNKLKREAARRAKQRREERDRKTRELEEFGAPKISSELTGSYDLGELGGSGVGDFKGKSRAEYETGQLDAGDKRKKKDEKEAEKAQKKAVRAHEQATQAIRRANEDAIESYAQLAQSSAEAWAELASQAIDGNLTAGEAFKILGQNAAQASEVVIGALRQQMAAQVQTSTTSIIASGAKAAGSQSEKAAEELPFPIGLALIPAIIASTIPLFTALLSKFATGGLVRGGTPGKDSVPALLTPGEFVLPKNVVDNIRSGRGPTYGPREFAAGGMVHAGGKAGGNTYVTIAPNIQQLVPDRDANFRRTMKGQIVPVLSELARDGVKIRSSRVIGSKG